MKAAVVSLSVHIPGFVKDTPSCVAGGILAIFFAAVR